MRSILLASFSLFIINAYSQTESFDSGTFPPTSPFTILNPIGMGSAFTGNVQWYRSDDPVVNGQFQNSGLDVGFGGTGNCVVMNSEEWCCAWEAELYLSTVNLTSYSSPRLKFYFKHPDGAEQISIDVDGGSGYNTLTTITSNYSNWTPIFVDLSSYGGNPSVHIRFRGTEGSGSSDMTNVGIDEIVIEEQINMTYISSNTFQTGCNMYQGGNDQKLMRIEVVTQGSLSPLNLTQMSFNTNGTTLPADISAEKLYYTGTDANFNTNNLVGSSASTGSYSINTTGIALSEGTNYFWLAYDIPLTATLGNSFDAECTGITLGSTVTPTITAPAGVLTLNNSNVFYVTNLNNSGAGSLRAAIAAANAYGCDAIVDARGVNGTINHGASINISSARNITVIGPGADKLNIVGSSDRFIYKYGDGFFTLEGLKIESFNSTTGAVYAPYGGIELKYCWFSNHTGLPFYVPGGDAWVYNTTFSNNFSANYSGAIYFPSFGSMYIYNSTFHGNTCNASAGAIYNPYGSLYLKGCTFKDNISNTTQGGGAIKNYGYLDAYNTTFDNNQCPGGGKDVSGTITMNNSHMSSPNGATISGGGNILSAPGDLDVLAQNGGSTPTCALLVTSPLINFGGSTPTKDQRDYCRVAIPDIGAFEFAATATNVVTADLTISTTELCFDDDLLLTATVSGAGTSPVFYWTVNGAVVGSGSSNSFSINASQLNNGSFIGYILETDLASCSGPQYAYSTFQIITVHSNPNLIATSSATSICEGDQITLSATCNSSYTLSWNNGVTNNNTFIPVSTGTTDYIVTVTDGTCSDADTITVTVNALPDPVFSIQNSTCGQNNGSVTITSVPNTTGPYTYLWTNGDSGITADSLTSGLYLVTITTGAGCENDATVYVNDANGPSIVNSVETEVTCPQGNDGAINITATGGTGTLTYSWNNGATTEDISNLSAGVYDVTVTDQSGCQTSDLFLISAPLPMVIVGNSSQPTCGNNDGSITVNVSGGNGGYTYLWDDPLTQTTATAGGLTNGIYHVTVTDQLGCSKTKTIVLNNGNGPSITADSVINVACGGTGGEIYVTVAGGSTPYSYLWSNADTNEDITGLTPGNYSLVVTDGGGCTGSFDVDIETDLPVVQEVCMVTVDTLTQTNLVIWEKPISPNGIAYFNIYREGSVPGDYLVIDTVQYNSLSQYTDPIANPQIRAWRYKISAVDSCGNESELGMEHKTIHLAANLGVGNVVNLSWGDYEGFSYPTYYINRYTLSTGWEVLDSLPNTLTSWTDANPPVGTPDYAITINAPGSCDATRSGVNTSRSNVKNQPVASPNSIEENFMGEIQIYPNPAINEVFIAVAGNKINNYELKVFNLLGELILSQPMIHSQIRLDTRKISSGIYTISISDNNQSTTRKIVITR